MALQLVRLTDRPQLKEQAAQWFHQKWGVPLAAYQESMEQCLQARGPVPQWYLAMEGERIAGGMGVIENDFHNRKDLAPNVCAVYTEPEYRRQGIAGQLLERAVADLRAQGIAPVYLLTDLVGFYERYGWAFFCMAQCTDAPVCSRIDIHR